MTNPESIGYSFVMADPGQNENLKELLGFDPDETVQAFPQSTNEKGDLIRKFEEFTGGDKDITYSDPNRLFTVSKYGHRKFYRFDNRYRRSFSPGNELHISDRYDEQISLTLRSDNNDFTTVTWGEDKHEKKEEDRHYAGITYKIAGRELELSYRSGKLSRVRLVATPENAREHSEVSTIPEFVGVFWLRRNIVTERGGQLPGITSEIDSKNGVMRVVRKSKGRIVDQISVPLSADLDAIKTNLFPEELLRNPQTQNEEVDKYWRGVDVFSEMGAKWDTLADDELKSLVRISQ